MNGRALMVIPTSCLNCILCGSAQGEPVCQHPHADTFQTQTFDFLPDDCPLYQREVYVMVNKKREPHGN